MKKKIWRGGMIGAGDWSTTQLKAWAGVEKVKIVALADRHPERRNPVAEQFGISQVYDNLEIMLDQADLDFVDICTRPYSHVKLTKLAADRGLPILCQKPFCESLEEAEEVVSYCRERGVRLMINENFRWQAWHRTIKDILNSGELGDVFFAVMHQRHRLTLPEFDHSQSYFAEMPRLLLYEVGTHLLDVARFLFGEPETVFCRLHKVSPEIVGEDVQVITLAYPEMTLVIHDSWASVPIPGLDRPEREYRWYPRLLEVDGTLGTLKLYPDGQVRVFTDSGDESWAAPEGAMPAAHRAAQQHFVDCLERGEEFETSGAETLKTMSLVYACYQSAAAGQSVPPRRFEPVPIIGHQNRSAIATYQGIIQ
jgi:predicted dehydrogenase